MSKVNITPLHDRVIVLPAAAEEKTASGIIIPDTAKEKPQTATGLPRSNICPARSSSISSLPL